MPTGTRLDEAIEWLEAHIHYDSWAARSGRTGVVDLSLDRMRRFMATIDDPHLATPIIHVTGTNGKGSTGRIVTRLLMAEGLRVGTYSSPHLARYNERFRIDDDDIDDDRLANLLDEAAAQETRFGERLMPFEVLTALAFTWFAREAADVAVVEVGVLGRFDATNVGDGRVAVVTNIGFDHTNGEGDWQARVADEKAGIVKPGAHLVLGSIKPRLAAMFERGSPGVVWRLGREVSLVSDEAIPTGRHFGVTTPWQLLADLELPLLGPHQSRNAAIAVAAASAFVGRPLRGDRVAAALASVRMPARLEIVSGEPQIIIDGAHNPDAGRALNVALAGLPAVGRRTLIIGLLAGRDPGVMLDAIGADGFDRIIACTPPTARARPAAEVAAAGAEAGLDIVAIDGIGDAITAAIAGAAGPDDQIVITGSIYLAADARAYIVDPRA